MLKISLLNKSRELNLGDIECRTLTTSIPSDRGTFVSADIIALDDGGIFGRDLWMKRSTTMAMIIAENIYI